MANTLIDIIDLISQMLYLILLARIVMSWIQVDRSNPVVKFIFDLTEPILAPIRNLLPSAGMMDFSPMVASLLILVVSIILKSVARSLF